MKVESEVRLVHFLCWSGFHRTCTLASYSLSDQWKISSHPYCTEDKRSFTHKVLFYFGSEDEKR